MASKRERWEQLRTAVLNTDDVGSGFDRAVPMHDREPDEDQTLGVMMMLINEEADLMLMVGLGDESGGSPAQIANATYYGSYGAAEDDPKRRIEIHDAAPLPFGEDGVHYVVALPEGSEAKAGETYAWRHLDVIACVTISGPDQPSAREFAERQQEKLIAVFGTEPRQLDAADLAPVPPIPRTACPGSHPIKAVSTHAGEMLYYVPADEDYEEAMAEACYGSVAAVEAAGYRRGGDPARQWRRWP